MKTGTKTTLIKIAVSILMTVVVLVTVIAYQNRVDAAKKISWSFNPGTYTASAMGKVGDVTVEVVFSDSAIVSVEVIEHSETAGICDPALEQVPGEIVSEQSLDVDTASGATVTSEAIIAAVTDCAKQAQA